MAISRNLSYDYTNSNNFTFQQKLIYTYTHTSAKSHSGTRNLSGLFKSTHSGIR